MKTKQALVPKLRFKDEQDNPYPDWEEKKLGDLGSFIGGGTPDTDNDDYWNGNVPWISSSDIRESSITDIQRKRFITQQAIAESATKVVPSNSILFISRVGVGKLAITEDAICTSQDFCNFTPSEDNIFYLGYYFVFNQNLLKRYAQGTSIKGITSIELKRIAVQRPSLPEQEKIAAFLTSVDDRIDQLKRKKSLLQDYKKGVMQKLFSQELRFKDEQGKPYPDWEEKKLGDVAVVNPRTPNLPSEFFYIDLESVKKGQLTSPELILEDDAPSRAQRLLDRGDILYQTVRPYQQNNYFFDLDGIYVASTGYAQLRTSESPQFIYHLIHTKTFLNQVLRRCTGTSYPAINSSDLAGIFIHIPSLPEQTKIANFLSSLDQKIEQIDIQITQTQSFKKGLLQQMFV